MSRPSFALAAAALLGSFLPSVAAAEETAIPLGGGAELKVIRVEPGTFMQGSPQGEAGRGEFEDQRKVTLTRAYYLGKYPVTRGQFGQFVKESGFRTESEKGTSGGFGWDGTKLVQRPEYTWKNPGFPQTDNDPVVMVTWDDAKAFLGWLSRKARATFDLPTEAQWEYACRAGSEAAFTSGADQNAAGDALWHKGNAESRTHPVGEKGENAWGFADMHGNVWEWCADWYGPYPAGAATDPVQTNANLSDKPRRVLRGGSWLKELGVARSAARYRNDPKSRNADNGFRVMAYELRPVTPIERTSPPSAAIDAPSAPPAVALERQNSTPGRVSQSAPPADSRSRQLPSQTSNSNRVVSSIGGLCCLLSAGAIILFIVRWIFKRGGAGGTSTTPVIPSIGLPPGGGGAVRRPGTVRTRMGDDGFWIDAEGTPPGTLLTCRYTAGGASQEIDVRYEPQPGGQFVYTGSRPTTVSVVTAGAGGGGGSILPSMMSIDPPGFDYDRQREIERQQNADEERRRRGRNDPPAY